MSKQSAGILMYRRGETGVEVLLVHPGGPYWAKKDAGAWSIPKGEYSLGEDPLKTAKREFKEELGRAVRGKFVELRPVFQSGGKIVHAFAVEGDLDTSKVKSNMFPMEWPPRSGRVEQFPEVDRAEWFDPATARQKLNPAQASLIDQLEQLPALADAPTK